MTQALVCIDFIDEIIGGGKLAQKGYPAFAAAHGSLAALGRRQATMRAAGGRVIHVHLGFAPDYADHPTGSPLLGGARGAGILQLGTPSTELHPDVGARGGDLVIVKKRVSAFFGTSLELTLRSLGATEVTIAGVATDLAVQSAARDAHDRDFKVEIAADACVAANDEDHDRALANMAKFASISA